MINHARTLLMKVTGSPNFHYELGEEIIPPGYRAISLPGALSRVRTVLFGASPDRAMLNYRTRQLLSLIHATELVEFVLELDPRVTYEFTTEPFSLADFLPSIEQVAGTGTTLTFLGDPVPPDASGRMFRQWLVTISGSNVLTQQLNPAAFSQTAYTITAGLSNKIQLAGTTNEILFTQPQDGDQWTISLYSRPQVDLGSLFATLKMLSLETLTTLFKETTVAGRQEPFKTFRNLFLDHHELAYSLGGAVLALIYSTEELRQ